MANSDIENFSGDAGSSPHVGASTMGPVRDLKSFLTFARQDRVPLESSNSSNRFPRGHIPSAASAKIRDEFSGRTIGDWPSKVSLDEAQASGESIDNNGRQRRYGPVRIARRDEGDDDDCLFSYDRLLNSEFRRQTTTVEAAQDRFRRLFAPKQVEGPTNFLEEIIDVDCEVGFGEDEDFMGEPNEIINASCDTSAFRSAVSCGGRMTGRGREGHPRAKVGAGPALDRTGRPYGEPEEIICDVSDQFVRSCSTNESEKSQTSGGDFMNHRYLIEAELCSGGDSDQSIQHSVQEDPADESLRTDQDLELEGDPAADRWLCTGLYSGEDGMETDRGEGGRDEETEAGSDLQLDEESDEIRKDDECVFKRNQAEAMYETPMEKSSGGDANEEFRIQGTHAEGVDDRENNCHKEAVNTTSSLVLAAITSRLIDSQGTRSRLFIMGIADRLREANERAERDEKVVQHVVQVKEETEQLMRQQQLQWSGTQKELESQIELLEMQNSRLGDTIRETAAALTAERQLRKDSRTEVDRILEMLKKERKRHQDTLEKLSACVNSFMKVRGNLATQKARSGTEDGSLSFPQIVETILRAMDRELQINVNHLTRKSSEADPRSSDLDEFSRWKQQRDALEMERDNVEDNMRSILNDAKERHGEMEVLWLERETLLEQKIGCLEVELQHFQMKYKRKEAEILSVRQRWAEELDRWRKDWEEERIAWEEALTESDQRLDTACNCMLKASDERCSMGSREAADHDLAEADNIYSQCERRSDAAMEQRNMTENDASLTDKFNWFCPDIGNSDSGKEAGVDKLTEDLLSREEQWEEAEGIAQKEVQESFNKKLMEMDQRVSDAVAHAEELKTEMSAKENRMELERKRMEAILVEKAAEVEKVNAQLKSKEHDMEVTVQKFMDEVRLIDKEVEKERKEREQVMELHFASKRKVVMDMKEREEKWEREAESRNQELEDAKRELRLKEKEIEELKRSAARAPSEGDRHLSKVVFSLHREKDALAGELSEEKGEIRRAMEEMLKDLWDVCKEERTQAAVAKRLQAGRELSFQKSMWDTLWIEYCRQKGISNNSNSMEWEAAIEKIAILEREISEMEIACETLRNELDEKERQLIEVREKRDAGGGSEKAIKILQKKERELVAEWQLREGELVMENDALRKTHKMEQDESAEVISNLQGVVRELEWALKQTKGPGTNHEQSAVVRRRGVTQSAVKSTEVVKVHTSYLDEVDRYISELEARMEVSEQNRRSPGIRQKSWGGDPEMNFALMKIEKELFSTPDSQGHLENNSADDDGRFSPESNRVLDVAAGHGGPKGTPKRVLRKKSSQPLEGNMCLTLNGLATLPQDTWTNGVDEQFPLWQIEDRKSITSWMSPRSTAEDIYSPFDISARNGLSVSSNSPATAFRRQQKWVVDVSWLEKVRKEHSWLRQQLEIERQRVAALGRVEADNRWIEAAIIRALELKRESDTKAADMQRKVILLEHLSIRASF